MKNNIYTAIPDWFNKVQSQSTDNTSTTTTQTTIIGGGGSISMSVHNLFIKSDTTITIDDFTISDLFVTDQITDTENWLTTPLLHTLPNTEVSVTTAAQLLYIGAYDKNNNQIKLYQFSEAISTVVIPENCYYLRASSNKTNTDLTIKYVGLNNFDETQLNKLESLSFQSFLTLVEGDEKGVITNSVLNLSLVFQNPLYYTLDKTGNVLISIDRDALFSQSENLTDDRYVTTVANSVQDILSSKNFKEGLSINGIEIVERNGFLYIKGNLATTGGITAYTDDPDDPGSSGGLPGGGAIGDIVITGSGNALVDASLSEDHSVITFTKGWLVDAESDQSITGIKDFINGIKLDGQLIKIVDGVLWLDCSIATTGGITAYATMPGEGSSSIMDDLVVDTRYFEITKEGVLTIVPGSLGGISNIYVTGNGNALTTVTLSEDGKTISFTKDKNFADQAEMSAYKSEVNQTIAEFKNEVNEQLKHFVTLDTEQEITAIKHFIEGVTIGSNKHKFYEKDGVLWLEGDIAITGGITTYATENIDVSTIMDGVTVDEETITKGSDNVLRIKNAGAGSSFDENAMWSALSGSSDNQINKSHLTNALVGYATESWVTDKGYITNSALNGYATEEWVTGKNYAVKATTLAGYGITDAYTKTESDDRYPTKTGSGASGTWNINVTGNAGTASKLQKAQTIWGQSFDGSKPVTGALIDVTDITGTGTFTGANLKATDSVYVNGIRLHKTADGVITLEGNLAVTGGITAYSTGDGSGGDSSGGLDTDLLWELLAGSGDQLINKTHLTTALSGYATESWVTSKNYLTSVKIATISDLHSSWDSVLAAQKPAWLTAVSIATISDLHANWDALLKAAPSAYVTRWPTISEVTGKQNLVVKLNGGTTEGTNQFTYNATGAKTINITPAGIGAYTKSESDSKYPTKTGSGASGTWNIDINGTASDADKLDGYHETDFFRARDYISYSVLENFVSRKSGTYNVGYGGYSGLLTVFYFGAGSTSAMEILAPYYDPSRGLQLRYAVDNNRFTSWRSFAFEDGNIASATKLQTTRKLWGRPFDGTDDVIGDMTISGNISSVGYINGGFRVDYGDDKVGLRWAGVHHVEFGGNTGYAHTTYFFHPSYSSSGSTQATIVIENASASNTPTFTTTHSFNASGVGYHKYGLGVGRTAPNDGYAGGIYAGTILANNWFRSEGSTGWLNQTYGGGWYMVDENFIRALGEKSVYLGKGSYRNAGGDSYYNNLENISEPYNCRYMSETTPAIPTGYIHPFCGWSDSATGGWLTSYVIGSIRNYANNWGEMYFGIYQYEGARREWKAYMALDGANRHLYINGNLMVTGGGTFYGSDIRYKSIIQQIKLSLLDIAEAPSFVYRWNKKEMICDRLNIGGSAQYTKTILPWAVEEKNNLLTMDYATVAYTFAVHTARHLLDYETKTDKEIRKLKNRIKYLEKQLKSLHYEEANIVDN